MNRRISAATGRSPSSASSRSMAGLSMRSERYRRWNARRAVAGGGVRLDGGVLEDPDAEFEVDALRGKVLAVGKRRFG